LSLILLRDRLDGIDPIYKYGPYICHMPKHMGNAG